MTLTKLEAEALELLESIEWAGDADSDNAYMTACPSCGARAHFETGLDDDEDDDYEDDDGEDLSDEDDAEAFALQVTERHMRAGVETWVHNAGCKLKSLVEKLRAKAVA